MEIPKTRVKSKVNNELKEQKMLKGKFNSNMLIDNDEEDDD